MMPSDEHEAFGNVPEDQRKGVPDEFLKDGQDQRRPTARKFERPLRDYLAIFRACEMHRTLFADRWESAHRDLGYLETAGKEADKQLAWRKRRRPRSRKNWAAPSSRRRQWPISLPAGKTCSRSSKRRVQAAIAKNLEYAQEIAKLQKEAADLIDRRMRSMAQSGPRTN